VDAGVAPVDAVTLVRAKRRGAINKTQLNWITNPKTGFKPKRRTNLLLRLFGNK
jgi:hypothetical protein